MNDSELARFFLSLVLLLVGALGGSHLFERLKMPRVIGEIAGGIVLGPSVLVTGALLIPFIAGYMAAPLFSETRLGDPLAFKLVMGIAVAVTSIPVLSRIFLDLGLMDSSFARNVISAATIQDLILWTVLAIATAVQHGDTADAVGIGRVIAITLGFVLASLFLVPIAVRAIRRRIFGKFGDASLTGYT